RDTKLKEKLKSEWPAILRWMVEGCEKWTADGLCVPEVVRQATDTYFEDQDTLGQWLDECTEPGLATFVTTQELFASWKTWCEGRNTYTGSINSFSEGLSDKNFAKGRQAKTGRRGFEGLVIKPSG